MGWDGEGRRIPLRLPATAVLSVGAGEQEPKRALSAGDLGPIREPALEEKEGALDSEDR